MKLDIKQKVLLEIYKEYQEDIPNIGKVVNAKQLMVDDDAFKISIVKLENEHMINGTKIVNGGYSNIPISVILDRTVITNYGIKHIEDMFNIKPILNSEEKIKLINEKLSTAVADKYKLEDMPLEELKQLLKESEKTLAENS